MDSFKNSTGTVALESLVTTAGTPELQSRQPETMRFHDAEALSVGVPVHTHPATSKVLLTNDSKATVSVLYWYGNYPNLTGSL